MVILGSLERVNRPVTREVRPVDPTVIVLVIVVVVLLLALAAAGVMLTRKKRSEQLQERFGPEYERSVTEKGDRRAAEAELAEREKRHRELDIRPLRPEERERYEESWAVVQRSFVDDPVTAVRDADLLVIEIMRVRGYPVDEFDRRAEDISVEHPQVVHHYREARSVHDATREGRADTEQQRHAVTSYRSLVTALLGHGDAGEHTRQDRTRDSRGDNGQDPDSRISEERTR
jgi:hypothetical protein